MASGDQATGIPDYQLRRKVATPPPGFEPGTQRLTVVCATAALRGNSGRRWGAAYASPLLFHIIKPFGPTCERCRASCNLGLIFKVQVGQALSTPLIHYRVLRASEHPICDTFRIGSSPLLDQCLTIPLTEVDVTSVNLHATGFV